MAFNNVGQYSPSHKTWDHVGNMIPVVEHSEGVRPHGEFMPAAWLPVKFFDKFYENWMTVMPGKILAFDNDNRVVPAQYGLAAATVTYTTNDTEAGVIDVRTGAALVSGAEGTFNVSDVTDFMGRGVAMAVSSPVGVAPYPILQWAGDGSALDDGFNPAAYREHNYNMQHRVAILCDYVLELPIVPAKTTTANITRSVFDGVAKTVTFDALANLPVAANTQRTTMAFSNGTLSDTATRFANQLDDADDIAAAGDWHIDLTTGVITAYASSDPGAGNIYKLTYWNYASAPTGSNVSVFACVLGDITAGDFLKCNADSNWVVDSSPTVADTMGQVLEVEVQPRDGLDKVRTAFSNINTDAAGSLPGYAGQMDQMPGSATGGVTDKVHFAGAANKVCRVNLVTR